MKNLGQQRFSLIISGFWGTSNLQELIEQAKDKVEKIILHDVKDTAFAALDKKITAYPQKSLNDILTTVCSPEGGSDNWYLFIHATESFGDFEAILKELSEIKPTIRGANAFIVKKDGTGLIHRCTQELRCFRAGSNARVEIGSRIVVDGEVSNIAGQILASQDFPIPDKVANRRLEEFQEYLERNPDDLQAQYDYILLAFDSKRYEKVLQTANYWRSIDDYIPEKYMNALVLIDFSNKIENQIVGESRILDIYEDINMQNHLDYFYLKCSQAFQTRKFSDVLARSKSYLEAHRKIKSSPEKLAQNGVETFGKKGEVLFWRAVATLNADDLASTNKIVNQLFKGDLMTEEFALSLLDETILKPNTVSVQLLKKCWQHFQSAEFIIHTFDLFTYEGLDGQTKRLLNQLLSTLNQTEKSFELAMIFMRIGKYREAGDVFMHFSNDAGVGEKAMFLGAQMYLEIGEFEMAQEILQKLLEEYPSNKDARLLLESVMPDTGDVLEAIEHDDSGIEEALLEAVEAIFPYADSHKFDDIIPIVRQIHDVLSPYSEAKIEIFSDFLAVLNRIEALAIAHTFLKLADEVRKLIKNVNALDPEKVEGELAPKIAHEK